MSRVWYQLKKGPATVRAMNEACDQLRDAVVGVNLATKELGEEWTGRAASAFEADVEAWGLEVGKVIDRLKRLADDLDCATTPHIETLDRASRDLMG